MPEGGSPASERSAGPRGLKAALYGWMCLCGLKAPICGRQPGRMKSSSSLQLVGHREADAEVLVGVERVIARFTIPPGDAETDARLPLHAVAEIDAVVADSVHARQGGDVRRFGRDRLIVVLVPGGRDDHVVAAADGAANRRRDAVVDEVGEGSLERPVVIAVVRHRKDSLAEQRV